MTKPCPICGEEVEGALEQPFLKFYCAKCRVEFRAYAPLEAESENDRIVEELKPAERRQQ
jgi:hypothetical protein